MPCKERGDQDTKGFANLPIQRVFIVRFYEGMNIENLHITVGDQQIVRGLTLRVPRGEVQALNSRRLDLRTASSLA